MNRPKTVTIDGIDIPTGSFSAEEFAALVPPPCPVCGAPVDWYRVDVTLTMAEMLAHGRRFTVGRFRCPHDCNPRTGQRYHGAQKMGQDFDGRQFECSCGFTETGMTVERLAEIFSEHPIGKYTP
jgi:hypothetical protein